VDQRDTTSRSPRPLQRIVFGVLSLTIVALAFGFLLPALVDYGDVWQVITDTSPGWTVAVAMAGIANQAAYPLLYTVIIPGLAYRHALATRLTSTAVANTVPGGGAIGVGLTYMMLSSWGTSGPHIATAVMLTGVWNNLIKLALPLLSLTVVVTRGQAIPGLAAAALWGLAALAAIILAVVGMLMTPLRRYVRRLVETVVRIGVRLFGTDDTDPVALVDSFLKVLREAVSRRWGRLAAAMVLTYASQYVVLLVAMRAVGVGPEVVHWTEVLAGFALVRLIAIVPITPGAVGLAELGVTAYLGAGLTEAATEQIAAGVLLFRTMDYALEIPAGAAALAIWRFTTRGGRDTQDDDAAVGDRASGR
jgi:uncharacterized membrane protein YbhN (UPF0104 family)